jgi:hypothetical protein
MPLNKILTSTIIIAALSITATAPAGAGERHGRASHASAVYRGSSVSRGSIRVAPRVIGSRGVVVGPGFSRPYYSFRPRLNVGSGLWVGYPVSYPYYYDYPYGYGYPSVRYAYGYPPSPYRAVNQPYEYPPSAYPSSSYPSSSYPPQPPAGASVGVQPGAQQSAAGAISFEITPSTAAVFADGGYVGNVAMFDPASQPLGLTPGRHHIEIRAAGYQTMAFDTDVSAGQVLPYQGTLQAAP